MKWSWASFFGKLTSRKFWVWTVTTGITHAVVKADGNHGWITPVIVVWGVISFIYLCGEVVIDAIGKAIEKADIDITVGGSNDRAKQTDASGPGPYGPPRV